jgi:hypothetical protein
MSSHQLAEERSLAYHRRVAELLASRPELVATAKARAREWASGGARSAPYAQEWLAVLSGSLEELRKALVEPSEQGRARRQATPFSGALDPRERWRIWREVRAAWEI